MIRTRWPRLLGPGLLSLVAPACGPIDDSEPGTPATPGALGLGVFTYCDGVVSSCDGGGEVPDYLAVGATFTLQFSPMRSGDEVSLSSSDKIRLEEIAANSNVSIAFRAVASGSVQVQAHTSPHEALLDFVELDLQDIHTLAFRACPRSFNAIGPSATSFEPYQCGSEAAAIKTIDVSRGSSVAPTVCAFPLDGRGDQLDGSLTCDWALNTGGSAEIELFVGTDGLSDQGTGHGRCATIGGLTVGTASVTVSLGTTSGVLNVTVRP